MAIDPRIAVVGMGGIFPGARSPLCLWNNILQGIDTSREVPAGRWAVDPATAHRRAGADRVASLRACLVDPFDFDPQGLDVELRGLDPVYLFALEAARAAWRDGHTDSIDRERVGVMLASIALPTDMSSRLSQEIFSPTLRANLSGDTRPPATSGRTRPESTPPQVDPRNRQVVSLPAALVARALGLGGATLTLDAACASSLYALKLACDELAAGRADAMLAGGVSRPDCLYTQMGFTALGALSPSGRCSPFDAAGDGLVVGEGAGVFLLKRLEDALAAGDVIQGVIRGIGLSNDLGGSLLAPDAQGQLRAMQEAYRQAGWSPAEVALVECHGTGTPVGDRVEFQSLMRLWEGLDFTPGQCALGSVKSMIGHLLTAAGAAGMVKVLKALGEGVLPPSANFTRPGPGIVFDGSPFRIQTRAEPWPEQAPRRAAVSAFGFGGINAHVLLEQWSPPARVHAVAAAPSRDCPVAIVGLATRFGELRGLRAFLEAGLGGHSAVEGLPGERWNGNAAPWLPQLRGAYIRRIDVPVGHFRVPPRDIPSLLPQQLLILEVAAQAAEAAGLDRQQEHHRAGAVIGIGLDPETTGFHLRWVMDRLVSDWCGQDGVSVDSEALEELREAAARPLDAVRTLGALGSIVASRVARELAFGGPSFSVSCQEASGLKALEIGLRALQRQELDCCLVGAVDLAGDPRAVYAADQQRRFARDGQGRPFEARASGPPVGEGAVALVLKRLEDARRDGDTVYAVVRGVGSAGGRQAYDQALKRAYADAGVEPASVTYLEAHGSADPTEDAREAEAVRAFFGAGDRPLALGSLTPVVGQAGAAAGLASLARAAGALYHQVIPALLGFERPAQTAGWGRIHMPLAPSHWVRDRVDGPRRAGVSCMTGDGNCMHVVLEEDEDESRPAGSLGRLPAALLVVGGDLTAGLDELARAIPTGRSLDQLAREHNRQVLSPALALVVRDLEELGAAVEHARECVAAGRASKGQSGVFYNPEPTGGEVAFVYPGSGSHHPGMGRELGLAFPQVLRHLDATSQRLASHMMAPWTVPYRTSWETDWERQAHQDMLCDQHRTIFGQVMFGVVATAVLAQFGVRPQAVVGYSLGESAGLMATGAWADRDEMYRRTRASTLFSRELAGECRAARAAWGIPQDQPWSWKAVVLNRPAAEVRAALAQEPQASLLIVNTARECVVGGGSQAVDRVVKALGCDAFPLDGVPTVHCCAVEGVAEAYYELHLLPTEPPAGVRYYSGNWARAYEPDRQSAARSILDQARAGIDFPATVEQAYEDGVRVFVEVGPQGSCSRMIRQILGERPHFARSLSVNGQSELLSLLYLLAALVAEGVAVDLSPLSIGLAQDPEKPEAQTVSLRPGSNLPVRLERPLGRPVAVPAPALRSPTAAPPQLQRLLAPLRELEQQLVATSAATASAHQQYLELGRTNLEGLGRGVALQTRMLEALLRDGVPMQGTAPPPCTGEVAFTREQCLEFAVGSIARVLGPAFAEVDSFPTRVRLPDEPLMLVDRILELEGEPDSLDSGRLVTEHDVCDGAWYLDAGRAPVCISVEAGQADLFLSAYLGIDLRTRGLRVYRLLDATVEFHRGLPRVGEVIRYDIRILRFVRQGEVYLFFFEFDGTVGGKPVITMRDGCAGFFTREEIDNSGGMVLTPEQRRAVPGKRQEDWRELAPSGGPESYDDRQVAAFRRGDMAGCFGAAFAGLGLVRPAGLPQGRMKLFDRVSELDLRGGRFGLGRICAEADIHPDDWFLTCHFVDDMVMPGTLMYECCAHTLRFLLARIGWVAEQGQVAYEPVPGVPATLRCRGPVDVTTSKVVYQVDIKEIGYGPQPYVLADALMFADGKPIVRFVDMSMRLSGVTRQQVEGLWTARKPPSRARLPLYDKKSIMEFSNGRPSLAFGEPYAPFDSGRRIARLPGPPYQFIDRVVEVSQPPFVLQTGDWMEACWDVSPDDWHFAANRAPSIAFCILLEAALQACGWLAAYCGSALHSSEDTHFRNLGGTATLYAELFANAGTVRSRARLTGVSEAGGMIIENFDMKMLCGQKLVYEGTTTFGFFAPTALARQVGLRKTERYAPTLEGRSFPLERLHPLTPGDTAASPAGGLCLPAGALLMIDRVDCLLSDGGPQGLGFIRGSKKVDPGEWFFKAHFYQDPVWPGSLGLEAFLQLLKVFALDRWGHLARSHRFEPILVGRPHTWVYRGQVTPESRLVVVEAAITRIVDGEEPEITAEGVLLVDGLPIYQMQDFGLRLVRLEEL